MLPQSEFESPMLASAPAPVAVAAITQDRALIGLLRSVVDPSCELIFVSSESELTPHLNSRRVSVALLDSMFVEGDLAALAERLRENWSDLVLVVVGTAEEQGKVASQITSGVVYRFLHRPVSAPRVRLFVEAALRRHEVENVERTLENARPDFSRMEAPKADAPRSQGGGGASLRFAIIGLVLAAVTVGGWYLFSDGKTPAAGEQTAQVVREPAPVPGARAAAPEAVEPRPAAHEAEPAQHPSAPVAASQPPSPPASRTTPDVATPAQGVAAPAPAADALRPASSAASARVQRTDEAPVENLPKAEPVEPPALTRDQRLKDLLAQAEAALQRGELASPAGKSAVELFRAALDLDPGNTLAKAGLVRVADRLHLAAERALTAGNVEDAKKMVDIAETLTPATSRGAFLMMQIEMEKERAALTAKTSSDAQNRQEKGATYLRLGNARLRSGGLIDPPEDNARFYLEAARQIIPDDPDVQELARALQKELLARAGAAATAGNAAETERWLANADAEGAPRPEMTSIRRLLQETVNGARNDKINALVQSFNTALAANKLLQPATGSAKAFLLALIDLEPGNPAVATARNALGSAYLRELRGALGRADVAAGDAWLLEAKTISFNSADLNAAESDLTALREQSTQQASVISASEMERTVYVAPKFPVAAARNHTMNGWVELEFTVKADGSTADVVVTNSSPRRVFDASGVTAVSQWQYKPMTRRGKAVDQRVAVRIRFMEE